MAESVLFVDDNPRVLKGFVNFIRLRTGFAIAGKATHGEEALQQLDETNPDILITDLSMDPMDGFELIRQIRSRRPDIPILATTLAGSENTLRKAFDAGADGFIYKREIIQSGLSDAITSILDDGCYVSPAAQKYYNPCSEPKARTRST